ncbi:MAG: ABC transporter ATP-binding protein [Chloroflexi bacterium]|nr:ABC transporter ATP-binding protein [Chloroflexota bacterium]
MQEFEVQDRVRYNRSSPTRWLISHFARYPLLPIAMVLCAIGENVAMGYSRIIIGRAFSWIGESAPQLSSLITLVLLKAVARFGQAAFQLGRNMSTQFLGEQVERDCRDELYVSLLGKSLTYHRQQRVGDMMARATNDVRQINIMANPGLNMIFASIMNVVVSLVMIASLRLELLLVPGIFAIVLAALLRGYLRQLHPVTDAMRQQFGAMNAGLEETLSGIEVVKANSQEEQEQAKFTSNALNFRNLFVKQGDIQARYLPFLAYSITYGLAFLHAVLIYIRGDSFGIGDIISYMGLIFMLRSPTFFSLFSFLLVQMGYSSAQRILSVLNAKTELAEVPDAYNATISGEVAFENVRFRYPTTGDVLTNISFHVNAGETIAIVGQTGSGKSTLTQLINRVYDTTEGRVLVDGVDVRDWSLEGLRSQIATIEQDLFLFSRTIADNITFGVGRHATQEEIECVSREAQAHDFIMSFPDGYQTVVGERGVTLSGGQRQRIAIARAFLTNPRILVLDDSTSAIDSQTEDEIQKAMYRVQQGRTVFLITHRLSQIRWADRIIVLQDGHIADQGTHDELLARSLLYRRIFDPFADLAQDASEGAS